LQNGELFAGDFFHVTAKALALSALVSSSAILSDVMRVSPRGTPSSAP
jgi:threonine/homoserine/homoserine lactone efflux protein